MRYYITLPDVSTGSCGPLKDGHDYKIIKVNQVDEANFLADYRHKVIAEGNSLMEALLSLEQWKQQQS